MDSVTQLVLGSAVGVLAMGRSQPVWKSAIVGGICGTLPDLDALIDHGDPLLNMVRHRAETHSIFWQCIAAPLVATVIATLDRSLDAFFRWWILVLLTFVTHAGLDAMTVYGTQLLLPLSDQPLGVASIFIIDPLYTLPLIFGLLFTLMRPREHRLGFNAAGLLISTAYLGWSWMAQSEVTRLVMQTPQAQGISADRILILPTPFNTVLWRVVIMREAQFDEGFYSMTDRWLRPDQPIVFESFPIDASLDKKTMNIESATELRRFSRGFYKLESHADKVRITDLRMGQQPYFVFSFDIARAPLKPAEPIEAITPVAAGDRENLPIRAFLEWMWARISGENVQPPRE